MSQKYTEWVTYIKDEYKPLTQKLPCTEAVNHPLKPTTIIMLDRKNRRSYGSLPSTGQSTPSVLLEPLGLALEGSDPLTQFAKENLDPLSQMAMDKCDVETTRKVSKERKTSADIEPWSARKAGILSRFTTSEKLSIVTSFLPGGEKVVVKTQPAVMVDKVKHRLEQLDDFEESSVRQMLDLTQQEYVSRIEQLNVELVQAWHSDQRVRSLKIAIQCAKLLVDVSVIQFYPSKFVLVTDILDIFGKLVYDRLKNKADHYNPQTKTLTALPHDFTPEMVPEYAKETCRNWFYKIASIRELVPRLYLEMAILRSYNFLKAGETQCALTRIAKMVRGVGDPLVAVYARCYLSRVAVALQHTVPNNFHDFLNSYVQVFSPNVRTLISWQNVELSTYLSLYTPALHYILQSLSVDASDAFLSDVISRCREQSNCALLLDVLMSSLKPGYVSARALDFLSLLAECQDEGYPRHALYRTLGLCLSVAAPSPHHRNQILSAVWTCLTALTDPHQYIACAEVWVAFTVNYFTVREINAFLGDIIKHLTPDRAYEKFYPQLKAVVDKVVTHTHDFEAILTMENLLPLVDLFQQENTKVEVCKSVMCAYCAHPDHINTNPVVNNTLMFICRILHDSVSAMTVEDERRQISSLISTFVRRVSYGRDFEQQLNFYVEARAAFANLDLVHVQLVQCVNKLSVSTRHVVKGHHTRKTGSFVRACSAYTYITIPSISSVCSRLELYLLSGQVALFNHCLGQADACFKAALAVLHELPSVVQVESRARSAELFLVPYLKNFLSVLLVVPDNPESGVLQLTRRLLNTLQGYQWETHSTAKTLLYLSVLDLLTASAQDVYPYHVDKVDSNDSLYGSDPKFISEINKMCGIIIDEILNDLKLLGQNNHLKKQSKLALELFVRVSLRSDLSDPTMSALATNLWNLSHRNKQSDAKLCDRTLEYLKKRRQT